MKATLRRALGLASEIESFRWRSVDDLEHVYYSIQHLRSIAIKLRAASKDLNHPFLRKALSRLPLGVDGHDFQGGVALHAELMGIAGWLRDAAEDWGDDPASWPKKTGIERGISRPTQDRALGTRERESLLTLVIGMAVGGYGYDPKANKSPTAREIAEELDGLGLSMDDDTVRKYLHQGAELLDQKRGAEEH